MFFFTCHFIECRTTVELNCKHDFHYLKHTGHFNPGPHPSSVLPVFTVQRNRPSKATIPNDPRWRFSGSTEHNTQTQLYSFIIALSLHRSVLRRCKETHFQKSILERTAPDWQSRSFPTRWPGAETHNKQFISQFALACMDSYSPPPG